MWLYFVDGEFGKVCFMFEVRYQWLFCARSGHCAHRTLLIYGLLVNLRFKYPSLMIDMTNKNNAIFYNLVNSTTFTKQAYRLVARDRGYQVYDRRLLKDKYEATIRVAQKITRNHEFLFRKIRSLSAVKKTIPFWLYLPCFFLFLTGMKQLQSTNSSNYVV